MLGVGDWDGVFEEDEGHGVASAVGVECGGDALGAVDGSGEAAAYLVAVEVADFVEFQGGVIYRGSYS